ncbi:MAG TPA: phage tail spike protein [Clostridium sp.]
MICLYDSKTTRGNFDNNGIVILSDCLSFLTTEKNNDTYEVEFEYPIDPQGKWKYILNGNIVKNSLGQLFRIYHRHKTITGIKATGRHIFYDLLDNLLEDVRPTNLGGAASVDYILSRTQYMHPFTSMGDVGGSNTIYFVRKNPIEAIMNTGGIIEASGGELVRDNFNIKLLQARGLNRGVLVSYGKNIEGIEEDLDEDSICTRALILGKDGLMLPEKYIDSRYINNFAHPKIKVVEFADIGVDADAGITEAQAIVLLRTAGQNYMLTSKCDEPPFTYVVSFLPLSTTEEYKNYAILESVYLCDTVIIRHTKLGMDLEAKAISITFNDLTKKIDTIELGSFKPNIATSINNAIQGVKQSIIQVTSAYQLAIENATKLITGSKGGNVVIRQNDAGKPYEILIMDTTDIMTAQNVWRWNSGGFGHSATGYNGPFDTAITQDGHIVGTFITALVINGGQIKTGYITSEDGKVSIGLDSGTGVHITGSALTLTNGNNEVVIDGLHNMHKILASGTITIEMVAGQTSAVFNVPHNLGYNPCYACYTINQSGDIGLLPSYSFSSNVNTALDIVGATRAWVNTTRLQIYVLRTSEFTAASTDIIKYFLYKEVAI